ncbi:MAG: methyltransferase domain-containing protein [Leptospirales bacterium]|nr:methyltransferase domain-containing protein [Leptospirales bacterium]
MNERLHEVQRFLEHCFNEQKYIEPPERADSNIARLTDVINTYKPEIIVKAGVGGGGLLAQMSKIGKSRIIVVEPSLPVIRRFIEIYGSDAYAKNINFVAGDFNDFPVDYYAADMIVVIDNISFIESSSAIDEFRRALQFDGILYLSTPVLSEDDEEGVFDDYIRTFFPLHNEFYMDSELKTVMELNEFSFVKANTEIFRQHTVELSDFFDKIYKNRITQRDDLVELYHETFFSCYGLNEGVFNLPYYSGVFMREKPDYAYEKNRL